MDAPKSRRNRIPVSCNTCRVRKLKCDRANPCNNCVTRSITCTYATEPRNSRTIIRHTQQQKQQDVHERVRHLESMVLSFMKEKSGDTESNSIPGNPVASSNSNDISPANRSNSISRSASGSPHSSEDALPDVGSVASSFGRLHVHDGRTSWAGPDHWSSILEDISEVKEYINGSDTAMFDGMPLDTSQLFKEPYLMLGAASTYNKAEILNSVPSKHVCDQLLETYFESKDPTMVVIHVPTFKKEYEEFWKNPMAVSNPWLALLCDLLCLGATLKSLLGMPPPTDLINAGDISCLLRVRAAQCLQLSNYTKPVKYTIEALTLYGFCEYLTNPHEAMSAYLIIGILVKLAMRAGYHRDSSLFPELTPFQGEMRRRVWYLIYDIDVVGAFQNGMPREILDHNCDAKVPRNLMDEDFDENSVVLPESRPWDTVTPSNQLVAKHMLCQKFGKIIDRSHATTSMQYDEVLVLDQEINETYQQIPLLLRKEGDSLSKTQDQQMVFIWRGFLAMLYQKARCVLHRRFFSATSKEARRPYSREVCVEASMAILENHYEVYIESQPGGLLENGAGMCASMELHDIILAMTILCYDLSQHGEKNVVDESQDRSCPYQVDATARQKQIDAMEQCLWVWQKTKDSSAETHQAYLIIEALVRRATTGQGTESTPLSETNTSDSSTCAIPSFTADQPSSDIGGDGAMKQDFTGSSNFTGFNQALPASSNFAQKQGTNSSNDPVLGTFGYMNDQMYDIDWNSFDTRVYGLDNFFLGQQIFNP